MTRRAGDRQNERGQILVLTGATILAVLFLGTLIVDVGNWFIHRRHLQTQVDAAALAAAQDFTGCFLADKSAANTTIRNTALLYAGDLSRQPSGAPSPPLNSQVTPDKDVHIVLNTGDGDYWPDVPSDGWVTAADPDAPCNRKYIDVKATDDDVPGLFKLIPFLPDIRANARVQIEELESTSGLLPWAIPEEDPGAVYAVFFNENTLDDLRVMPLQKATSTEQLNGVSVRRWTGQVGTPPSSTDGVNVTDQTGVVVLTSQNQTVNTGFTTLGGLCGQTGVNCYGGSSAAGSLALIKGHGALGSGTAAAPVLRDVIVNGGNCTQDQSAGYFANVAGCSPQTEAVVDFGLAAGVNPATINAKVSLEGRRMDWTPGGTGGALYGTWTVSGPNLAADSGQNDYSMLWSTGTGGLASVTTPALGSTPAQRWLAAAQGQAPAIITVNKAIPNDPSATPNTFQFTVTNPTTTISFEADGSNDVTVSNGPHDITETPPANYLTTYANSRNGNANCNNLQGGDSCTITNTARATINVVKTVSGGGPLTPSQAQISISGTGLNPSVASPFPGAGPPGTTVAINANTSYAVTEAPVLDYTPSYSAGCSGTLNRGQTTTCTITNTYTPASPATVQVIKSVVGGTASPSSFTISAASSAGGTASPSSFPGDASGTSVTVSANRAYTISEPAPGVDYTVTYSPGCSGTLDPGEVATCTVTNTFKDGSLTVVKQVSGGPLAPGDFTIDVNVSGGGDATPDSFSGSASGQFVRVTAGKAYTVSEPTTAGYAAVYSGGCSGTFVAGDTATCTVTNVFGSVGPPEGGSFGLVARPYATNSASGPVAYLRVLDQATFAPEYFLQTGDHDFTIEVGVQAALEVGQAGDPPTLLRTRQGPSSSLTQSIDCDKDNLNYPPPYDQGGYPADAKEIGYGCLTTYRTNATGDCAAYEDASKGSQGKIKLPPDAPNNQPPPECVITKQGAVSSLRKGLASRFENQCTQNKWPDTFDPVASPTDPRWVVLVVTDFGSFSDEGGDIVPVRKFAAFYVTGWDVSNETNGCPDNDLHPLQDTDPLTGDTEPNPNGDGDVDRFDYATDDDGEVWGHFGVYIASIGTGSGTTCDFQDSQVCIGVLVR